MAVIKLMDAYSVQNSTSRVDAPTAGLLEEFRKENSDWNRRTGTVRINAENTAFYYANNDPSLGEAPDGNIIVGDLSKEALEAIRLGKRTHFQFFDYKSKREMPEELVKEAVDTNGFLMAIDGLMYLVSASAVKTMAHGCGLGGDDLFHRSNLIRTMDIADAFYRTHKCPDNSATAIWRSEEVAPGKTVKKIFAVMSGKYQPCSPETLVTAAEEFLEDEEMNPTGDGAGADRWSIDHTITSLNLCFTKLGEDFKDEYGVDVTPGLQLQTSDVGESSMIARGVLYGEHGYVTTDEVVMKHSTKLVPKSFTKDVKDRIFAKVRTLPEKLASLMGVSLWDDTLPSAENNERVQEIFKKVFWECATPSKAGKEKVLKPLYKAMAAELEPGAHYTGYDLCMMFFDAPDRARNISESSLNMLRRGFGDAPFALERVLKEKKVYLA